jgi:hypothetical protein
MFLYIVICPRKDRIVEIKERAVARQWLCKHVSTATNTRGRSKRCTRNNRGTVGGRAEENIENYCNI